MHSGRWRQKILRRTMHGLAERAVIGRAKSMKFLPDAKLPEIISQMSASEAIRLAEGRASSGNQSRRASAFSAGLSGFCLETGDDITSGR
jgi:hypothetical protein